MPAVVKSVSDGVLKRVLLAFIIPSLMKGLIKHSKHLVLHALIFFIYWLGQLTDLQCVRLYPISSGMHEGYSVFEWRR